jgi:hypothetical protein
VVEQKPEELRVGGSIPSLGTIASHAASQDMLCIGVPKIDQKNLKHKKLSYAISDKRAFSTNRF